MVWRVEGRMGPAERGGEQKGVIFQKQKRFPADQILQLCTCDLQAADVLVCRTNPALRIHTAGLEHKNTVRRACQVTDHVCVLVLSLLLMCAL